jgi:hypothetical protein
MKRKMMALTGVCLSVIMLTGIIVSADMRTGDEKKMAEPVEEEFYYNNENRKMFTDEETDGGIEQALLEAVPELSVYDNVKKSRMALNGTGEMERVRYEGTRTFENMDAATAEESYGVYDEYSDHDDSTYYYLHSSDKLCLFMREYEYKDAEEVTLARTYSEHMVKDTADAYIEEVLGDDVSKYSFQKTEYQEQKGIYLVTYVRRIGEYITDDLLAVFLDRNAEVYAFSAMNRDRYDGFDVDDIETQSLNNALAAIEAGQYEMDDIRITMDAETQQLVAVLPK